MAIPYAGVHRQLKDAGTPWEKKVSLARFAWVSPRCFLPNKEQVLMDWAANSLANAHKLSVAGHAIPNLWQFLHDALQSSRILEMGVRAEGLSLRPSVFPAILKALHIEDINVELVIGCCLSLLGFSSLGSVITSTLDHQVQFLSAVVNLLTAFLKADGRQVPVKLNPLVQRAFASFASLLRQQPNPRKVFTIVYEKLLGPVLTLHYAITSLGLDAIDGPYRDTMKCIRDLIANGLFNRDLIEGHTKYLRAVPGQSPAEKQREVRLLQESIASLWKNMADKVNNKEEVDCAASYVAGMSVVFKAFLSVQKHPSDVSFAMLCKLCDIMGFVPAVGRDGRASPTGSTERPHEATADCRDAKERDDDATCSWTDCVPAVGQLLKVAAEKQIYEVAVDNMAGKTQFMWLCRLARQLIRNADSSSPACYDSLGTVLDMNHLILEDRLAEVLTQALYGMVQSSPAANAPRERDGFLEKLLATYTKLRQFDRLITPMMQACKTTAADTMVFTYPARFSTCFSESVQSLPPGLTLDIWKQFLDELLANYLPEITHSASTPSSPPPPKRHRPSQQGGPMVNLAAIAVTFDLFLRSARLVEASQTAPSLRRVEALMADTREGVLGPLLRFCAGGEPSVDQVHHTLLLCHAWGDLHLLLCQHTSYTGRDSFPGAAESGYDFGDFSFVHAYGTSGEWSRVCEMFAGRHDITVMQVHLAIQQVRALLLHSDMQSSSVKKSLVATATAVCDKVTDAKNLVSGDPLLQVLLGNLPLLLPFIPAHQLAHLASLLCETLSGSRAKSGPTAGLRNQQRHDIPAACARAGDATLAGICAEFVASEACTESRRLQTALVTSVLGQLSKVMRSSPFSGGASSWIAPTAAVLQRLSDEDDVLGASEADGVAAVTGLDSIAAECNAVLGRTDPVKAGSNTTGQQLATSVEGTLKIVSFLPLQYLLPSNRVRCMLGLLLVDHCLALAVPPTKAQGGRRLSALLLCRRLEAAILKGATNRAEFASSLDAWKVLCALTASFVDTSKKVTNFDAATAEIDGQLSDVTEELLAYWLKRLRQLPNQEAAFREYGQMVESRLGEVEGQLSQSKTPRRLLSASLPLLTVSTAFLATLFASRGASGSLGSRAASDLGRPIWTTLGRVVRQTRGAGSDPRLLTWLVSAGALLAKFTLRSVKLDPEDRPPIGTPDGQSDTLEEADAMELDVSAATVAKEQWTEVLNPVLQEVCVYITSSDGKNAAVIGSCLAYVQTACLVVGLCCDAGTVGMATSDMWLAMLSLMGTSSQWNESMMNDFQSTLSRITATMDLVQLKILLNDLLQDTSPKRDADANLGGTLVAWQLLPRCLASEETRGALADIVPQVMVNLQGVLLDAVSDWTLGGAVALSILQAVSSIVGQGESLISPDEAMQAQLFCLTVPVAKVTTGEFPAVFSAMCQILRGLLFGYPRTVMGSLASHFACLQHLLKGVMHRGLQRNSAPNRLNDHDLYMCAENMERLLTMLATYKNEVNKLAVFLVADYIAELQKGTLLPLFKKTLVTGVYNLLDACDERAVDYLNAKLPHNLREIFKTFHSDFQKYYRYSGKV